MASRLAPLELTVLYTEDEGQVVAQIKEVPAAISFGRTREEARDSVFEALRELVASYVENPPVPPEQGKTGGDSEPVAIHAELR